MFKNKRQHDKLKSTGGGFIKNIANIITLFRIIFTIGMVFAIPFSFVFWIYYFCGGISDLFDGFIARKLKQQSTAGAKLDSIADMVFAIAISIVVIKNFSLSTWLWQFVTLIALLRIISYGIGFYKYRTFASLHTYANKATGVLIFVFPLLYTLWGITITEIILTIVAFISSLEELVITIKSKDLNRDCKTIFMQDQNIMRK